MELHTLKPAHGSKKNKRRIGRGESSGAGKTSGRGGKGQTARKSGPVRKGFEGGQMPLYRRIPKLGFRSKQKTLGLNQYTIVNLSDLEKFEKGAKLNSEALKAGGISCHSKHKAGIKILGNGELTKALHLEVEACSDSAKKKIEALGGSVTVPEKKEHPFTTAKKAQKKSK
jgi:large subunit ribosomal protein L15